MEKILPESKEHWLGLRSKDVTSTEISALFGMSPYMTEFELWHRKKNEEIVLIEENERMKWGNRLEAAIAKGIADDNEWEIRSMGEYIRDPETRLGSSFDYSIENKNGILEIKNVDFIQMRDKWTTDGDYKEAPAHIELQLQHQLMVSEREFGCIAALVGGNQPIQIERNRNEKIITAIKEKARRFWKSIRLNMAPCPDFQRDSEFISELYGYAEAGKIVESNEISEILAMRYMAAQEKMVTAKKMKDECKARLLVEMGDIEKVKGSNFNISATMIGPAEVAYTRKGYRSFKVTKKKEKKA